MNLIMSDFHTKPLTVDRLQQCDLYSGEVFSKAFLAGRVDAQSFRKKRLEIINTKWQLDYFHADAMTLKNSHIACTNKHSLTQKVFYLLLSLLHCIADFLRTLVLYQSM